ncbi:MAG TPA: MBL fold metallo-hydrolase [Steroidobacteraceae bacterium]|nr:MBL fold metallo-hydrolase [Steroidobacteraceae bacterium]
MPPVPVRRATLATLAVLLALGALSTCFAPYLYPELEYRLHGRELTVLPRPTVAVAGRWADDYFVIEQIDGGTWAIGEPRYYQGNYSYLILGERRAVLYDAGTGTRDIVPIARSLTSLPITVIPSHLHFDHVGALGRFDTTALLDVPALRERVRDSRLTLERYEFLGFVQDLPTPSFRVDEWWAADSTVDLGGRRLRVLSTPGHTPTSLSLYDTQNKQAFVGDFMYPGSLYVFLPGASRAAYLATTRRLLALLDPATRLYTAHMADPPAPVRAPVLAVADLRALERSLVGIQRGTLATLRIEGLPTIASYPRVYPVSGPVTLATGFPWNNR